MVTFLNNELFIVLLIYKTNSDIVNYNDSIYVREVVMHVAKQDMGNSTVSGYYSKDAIELMLSRRSRMSPGIDDVPYCESKDCYADAEISNV